MGYHIQCDPETSAALEPQPRNPENAWPGFCMQDLGQRFYSPPLGRWLNRDPIEEWGGDNLLTLVRNNPIVLIDPIGLTPEGCHIRYVLAREDPDGTWKRAAELSIDRIRVTYPCARIDLVIGRSLSCRQITEAMDAIDYIVIVGHGERTPRHPRPSALAIQTDPLLRWDTSMMCIADPLGVPGARLDQIFSRPPDHKPLDSRLLYVLVGTCNNGYLSAALRDRTPVERILPNVKDSERPRPAWDPPDRGLPNSGGTYVRDHIGGVEMSLREKLRASCVCAAEGEETK